MTEPCEIFFGVMLFSHRSGENFQEKSRGSTLCFLWNLNPFDFVFFDDFSVLFNFYVNGFFFGRITVVVLHENAQFRVDGAVVIFFHVVADFIF